MILQEIHGLYRKGVSVDKIASQLSPWASALFEFLPSFIKEEVNKLPFTTLNILGPTQIRFQIQLSVIITLCAMVKVSDAMGDNAGSRPVSTRSNRSEKGLSEVRCNSTDIVACFFVFPCAKKWLISSDFPFTLVP